MNWGEFKTKGAPRESNQHVAFRVFAARHSCVIPVVSGGRIGASAEAAETGLGEATIVEGIAPSPPPSKSLPPNAESLTGQPSESIIEVRR
jgi:hypothetical protein